jgi:hypothetical protein
VTDPTAAQPPLLAAAAALELDRDAASSGGSAMNHPVELSVQQVDTLWDAVAIPGPKAATFPDQHERVCRAVAEILLEARAAARASTFSEAAVIAEEAVALFEGSDEAAAAAGAMEGVAARFRRMADELMPPCTCASGSPEMYEGPARDCPNHDEVEPHHGWAEIGVATDFQARDQQSVVAYRTPSLDVLYCVLCRPKDSRFVPVESADLPSGGICDNCDTDVLIQAPRSDAEIIEAAREIGLVEPEKAPQIVAAAREFLAESGVNTPGCDCGHEGMGPAWHLKSCAWLRTLNVPYRTR